jgi:hypothetical protein
MSADISAIAPALLMAQTRIGAASKDGSNPHFRSAFATLGAVMEACKDALNDQKICVLQPVGHENGVQYVETILLHSSGQFISDQMRIEPPMKMVCPNQNKNETFEPFLAPDPQAQGSAITYARRYALQSMLFIPAEDDDGEGAMNRNQQSRPTTQQQRPVRATQTADDL